MLIKDKYPYLPTSVIRMERTKNVQKLRANRKRKLGRDSYASNSSRSTKSNFPLKLAEFILKYYARDSKMVLDPFAGWGERGYIAQQLGYQYFGFDISPEAIEYAKTNYGIQNTLCDSEHLPLSNNSIDFCYSCPPYWKIERYESVEGQLSEYPTYSEFLAKYKKIITEIYRVLKQGALCAFVVGDFRLNKIFYDFSTDTINIFRDVGFEIFDKVIIDKSVNYRIPLFLPNVDKYGFTVKVHEYILVFKKPKSIKPER